MSFKKFLPGDNVEYKVPGAESIKRHGVVTYVHKAPWYNLIEIDERNPLTGKFTGEKHRVPIAYVTKCSVIHKTQQQTDAEAYDRAMQGV